MVSADKKINKAILLLGSNMGNKVRFLNMAVESIKKEIGSVEKQSSFYKTEAWGKTDQDFFINCAVAIQTRFSATEILNQIHSIENAMGRHRKLKWEPRTIDIDILFYNDEVISTTNLVIPHPEFENRLFAIIPVLEIEPLLMHPLHKTKIDDILAASTDKGNVEVYKN